MSQPARRQVIKEKVLGPRASVSGGGGKPGQTYNIYHDRWSGGGRADGAASKEKATSRCDPLKDSGTTRGTHNPNAYFCAFFAKGCCPNGADCTWLHRIPTRQDQVDSGLDVFGRERFADHRDDRGGVGSMSSENRTLYVGRIHPSPDMQDVIERHFRPWGELERIKLLKDKGVAFVTYKSRLNAEFAKIAMSNQPLDHGEIINIRWASEDPNPTTQAMNKRKAIDIVQQAIQNNLSTDTGVSEGGAEGSEKRQKQTVSDVATEVLPKQDAVCLNPAPTMYRGADGQHYYDYGDYGYNYETQQYDPTRLSQHRTPTLQDRVAASLMSTPSLALPVAAVAAVDAKRATSTPSALGALAAYGSDSENDSD